MHRIKFFFEKNAFGVCTYLGNKFGISSKTIRLYFIYTSCLAIGSPLIIYLVLAFWLNFKKHILPHRSVIWDL